MIAGKKEVKGMCRGICMVVDGNVTLVICVNTMNNNGLRQMISN